MQRSDAHRRQDDCHGRRAKEPVTWRGQQTTRPQQGAPVERSRQLICRSGGLRAMNRRQCSPRTSFTRNAWRSGTNYLESLLFCVHSVPASPVGNATCTSAVIYPTPFCPSVPLALCPSRTVLLHRTPFKICALATWLYLSSHLSMNYIIYFLLFFTYLHRVSLHYTMF